MTFHICKRIFIYLFVIFHFLPASAQEIRRFYNGVRALGMGNSSTAVVNDETALLQNPAALGKLRDYYGTIIDPEVDIGWKITELYRVQAFSSPFSIEKAIPSVVASPETYFHSRSQIFPSFVAKNFGIGLYGKYLLDAEANAAATSVNTFYQDDLALVMGFNLRLFDGRIKIGAAGRLVSRIEVVDSALDPNQNLDMASLAAAGKAAEGVGIGIDAGLLLAAPWTYIPTIGVMLHDVGGTKFDTTSDVRLKGTSIRPASVTQDADVAVALFPIHTNFFRSTWTVEYRNVLTASTVSDTTKLYHGGLELNFGDVFFLRAGYNQRYWTAGVELASERIQMQLASYGEEVGTTIAKEDRRYVAKFAFRF